MTSVAAQGHTPRIAVSATRASRPPLLDGRLTDDCWAAATPVSSFTQRDPSEGQPASERTEVRIVYDDTAVYVGARMYDRDPSGIGRRLSARDDEADADQFGILLDPRHDHVTGAGFVVSAAGVQRDFALSNDSEEDRSWDAVWHSSVAIDDEGWTAELRIPFSQLRFAAGDHQTWGVNAARFIRRKNETAWLELVPKNEHGQASRMAHLTGIDRVRPARHVEVVPYTAASAEYVQPERAGDPFNDGSRQFGRVGFDLKASVMRGLTLDVSVNPDFGQAEVDPAVVNLTAFETFFEEKRRFFIEGSEIFGNFGRRGADLSFGFNTADPGLFYTRRIGRAPTGDADGDFVDRPRATTILGAGRLTGKTPGGWSIGLVEAVTGRSRARVMEAGVTARTDVEPAANYAVARVQRDFARGGAGVLATSVVRRFSDSRLADALPAHAFVVGGDGFWYVDASRDWVVNGKLSGSHVSGSEAAIARLQRAPQRYYQRPDAPHVTFDPTRTSLDGFAGRVNLTRNNGAWRVHASLWGVSPGFESNDLGFQDVADRFGGHGVVLWRDTTPGRFARERSFWVARAGGWNFNRDVVSNLWFSCGDVQWVTYWSTGGCGARFARVLDDRLTRGGALAVGPEAWFVNGRVFSDERKAVSMGLMVETSHDEFGGGGQSVDLFANVKPSPSLTVSIGPSFVRSRSAAQYVETAEDAAAAATFGRRDVFARLRQTQVRVGTRVSYIIGPRASLQFYMEPLLAAGAYGPFKELARPRTFDFLEYGTGASTLAFDPIAREYEADPDGAGTALPFSFGDPDFNYKSFKVNAVLRWEFRPGSTIYLVWTQQREDTSRPGRFAFRRDAGTLFAAPADDVVLVKMTYWLGR